MKTYDVNYFIKKFESLKDEEIGAGDISKHCSLWHCGCRLDGGTYTETEESTALIKIFGGEYKDDFPAVYRINDLGHEKYQQPTPKQRILAALYDIKRMQEGEESQPKVEYKLVYSDQKVKDLVNEKLILS